MAFKNTPTQYFRKPVDAAIQLANKEITKEDFSKVVVNYLVVQPIMYTLVGHLMSNLLYGDDEDDNLLQKMMWALVISPFNAIPLLEGIMKFVSRKMQGKKIYKPIQFPIFDDINLTLQKAGKKDKTMYDYLQTLYTPVELGTALPARQLDRLIKKNIERLEELR